jgi:competence protein ComEC
MIILNPYILLHDPSFQLSFLATLGLILLASPLEKMFWFVPEHFGLRGICVATFATQIFVSPFIIYMMGQISMIGVVANILVLPVIPLTMLVVFLGGATGFIVEPVSQFFGYVAHLLLNYELYIVEMCSRVPYASISFPVFSGWWVVGFYVLFFVVYGVVKWKVNKSITIVPS